MQQQSQEKPTGLLERRRQRRRQQRGMPPLIMVLSLVVVLCSLDVVIFARAQGISCAKGWGEGSPANSVAIPSEWIDDGYCDCPFDGLDEPNTNACSGAEIGGWSGIAVVNKDSPTFQCPQQPKKKVPLSRINDGVCDCCDGGDEYPSLCSDICDEVMAAERAERERMVKQFKIGYEFRQRQTLVFEELVKTTHQKMNGVHEDLSEANTNLSQVSEQIKTWKMKFLQQRLDTVRDIITNNKLLNDLFKPVSTDALIILIVHTCQMAGEMEVKRGSNEKTCVPLRLAGLDVALMWQDEDLETGSFVELSRWDSDSTKLMMLADIMHWNLNGDGEKFWNRGGYTSAKMNSGGRKNSNRRRLQMDDEDEDDYDYEVDDDYHRDMGDDEYYDDEDEDDYDYDYSKYNRNSKKKKDERSEKENELLEFIEGTSFSRSRVSFLQHARKLVNRVEELLKVDVDSGSGDEDSTTDEENKADGDATESRSDLAADTTMNDNIDPVAVKMVRNTLERRMASIERGMNYAVSAKLLLASVVEPSNSEEGLSNGQITTPEMIRDDLISLAAGTLFHSRLSASHLWQILSMIVPELKNEAQADSSTEEGQQQQTCSLPVDWQTISCPPRTIDRNSVQYPPQEIVESVEKECSKYDSSKSSAPIVTCEASDENVSIPDSITDNYYGYSIVTPRDSDSDVLSSVFSNWDVQVDEEAEKEIENLETENEKLEKITEDLEQELKQLTDEIGGAGSDNNGDEGKKFGPDGELHALKDDCLAVEANKYIYEICLFGKAAQKDRDKPKAHGTDLGKWTGMEFVNKNMEGEPTEHQRILKWENGQSCWNGPRRSATAYVTCGSENKLLSAEEPDTCRYVIKMQSPIACDDIYKALHGL